MPSSTGREPSLTASAIVSKTVTGSHVLIIESYSHTRGIGTGKCVTSRPFTVGGHQWCLEYYPDGYNSFYGPNWISIRLRLAEAGDEARALYKITLLYQDFRPGKIKAESSTCCTFINKPNISLVTHGSDQFIKNEDLLKSSYLKDDSFSIRCDITVVTDIVAEDFVATSAAELGVMEEARGV